MDCKTFDDHLLDELYGELDEVTSAAMARHAESCSSSPSCATKLAGLRSAREALTIEMPYVEPPEDLEDRILAATRDARPVIPLRRKVSGAVSWAGAWAMRPQTAMAAVFLLMIGSSLAFLRTHRSKSESSNAVAVSELGKPELSAPMAEATGQGQLDTPSPIDRGASGGAAASAVAAAAPAPMAAVPMATSALGSLDEAKDDSSPRGRATTPSSSALALNGYDNVAPAPPSVKAAPGYAHGTGGAAAGDPADAKLQDLRKEAVASRAAASKPKGGHDSDGENSADLSQASNAAPGSPPSQAAAATQAASSDDAFTRGQQAYTARRFDEARDDFDAAAGGNVAAALWAARSVRDGQGCAGAVSRFDDVVNRAPSSSVGFDARLEGARCYRALGKTDAARARLVPLLTVPSHATRAQAELATMAPPPAAAARKSAPSSTGGN